jgi:hypothetical protein
MESSDGLPTPEEGAVALAEAEASRTMLADSLVLRSWFYAAIGAAITVQIATTALGHADIGSRAGWLLPAGVVVSVLFAGIRRRGGVGGVRPGMVAGGALRGRRRRGLRVEQSLVAPDLPGRAGGARPG